MDSIYHSSVVSNVSETIENAEDATGIVTRAIMANYTKGDPVAEEFVTRVRNVNFKYYRGLFKSIPKSEMKKNKEMVKMVTDVARETALEHGFLEADNDGRNRKAKLNDEEFLNKLHQVVILHVMESKELLEMEFFDHFIESRRERMEWLDDGEEKESQMHFLDIYETVLDEKDPFVVHNGIKMRSSKKEITDSKEIVTRNKAMKNIADFKNRLSEIAKRKREELHKLLKDADKPTEELIVFRMIADLIYFAEKDIDETIKNPEMVKIVSESLSALDCSPSSIITFRKEKDTSDALVRAIWNHCENRNGAAAEELLVQIRRADLVYCKKLFLLMNPGSENDWKMQKWFEKVCGSVGVSSERYIKMTTNPEMMEVMSGLAKEIALKHGFSEVHDVSLKTLIPKRKRIQEEGNRNPKLKERKFHLDLCLSVLNHVLNSSDPLQMEFRDELISSTKERIASMEDCERKRNEISNLKTFESILDKKTLVIYDAGDIDKEMVKRNKRLKSLEEGSEEEIEEEKPSFLSSML
uniref:RNF213 n=1 Tax=Caenorhabditis tropicalis TaxID=1561998 RepID=A0A1I7TUC3_9PELO